MEVIAALPDSKLTTIVQPTFAAFAALAEKNKEIIESVPRQTFAFGTTDRHKLDVYYPAGTSGKVPVLFFFYGGGFHSGNRVLPMYPFAYKNVGAFFASQGFIVVIADYRLVPDIEYPAPAEDVRDAVNWVAKNAETIRAAGPGSEPDVARLFVTGHSAGASHVATVFLESGILALDAPIRSQIMAIALMSCPYTFKAPVGNMDAVRQYYGTDELMRTREPLGLLQHASTELLKNTPPIIFVEAQNEPEQLKDAGVEFRELAAKRMEEVRAGLGGSTKAELIEAQGHNHLSLMMCLSSGEGEDWAKQLVQLFKLKQTKV